MMRLNRAAEIVTAAEIPIVPALAPVLLFPTPRRLAPLFLVPAVWLCARVSTGRAIPRTPLNSALAVMVAMVGVSLYATFDIRHSLAKICGVALGILLFLAIARRTTTPARLRAATGAFLVAGALLAVVGVLSVQPTGKVTGIGAVVARSPLAIRGLPGAQEGVNPNPIAGMLVLFVPLQIVLLVRSRRTAGLMVAQCALLAVTLGGMVLMHSRAAWVGLAAGPVVLLVVSNRAGRLLAAIGAGTAGMVLAVLGPQRLLDLAVNRVTSFALGMRLELWSRALIAIHEHPYIGLGMNVFRKRTAALPPAFRQDFKVDLGHAHNHFLQAAVDLGIPGLIAYLALWMLAGLLLVQTYRHSGERVYRAMAAGLAPV